MPSGLGGQHTIVRVEGGNKKALSAENLNGDVLHAAQNFYRQQSGLRGSMEYAHKNVQTEFPDGSSAIFDYKYNSGQEYLSVQWSAREPEEQSKAEPSEAVAKKIATDLVWDGYISVGIQLNSTWPGVPSYSDNLQFKVLLNGVDISGTQTANPAGATMLGGCDMYVFEFGKGAMKSHSWHNDENNPHYPKDMLMKIIPPYKDKKGQEVEDKGTGYRKFYYPLYYKENTEIVFYNQSGDRFPDGEYTEHVYTPTPIIYTSAFDDLGPLKFKDINTLTIVGNDTTPADDSQPSILSCWVIAEFYSRNPKDYRPVVVSARNTSASGATDLLTNPKPLFISGTVDLFFNPRRGVTSLQAGMPIDLSESADIQLGLYSAAP